MLGHLLERFVQLHRDGQLEEAATTARQRLTIMESKRTRIISAPANGLMPSNIDNSADQHVLEKSDFESTKRDEDLAIAGVMNDLGCTLQQVSRIYVFQKTSCPL